MTVHTIYIWFGTIRSFGQQLGVLDHIRQRGDYDKLIEHRLSMSQYQNANNYYLSTNKSLSHWPMVFSKK